MKAIAWTIYGVGMVLAQAQVESWTEKGIIFTVFAGAVGVLWKALEASYKARIEDKNREIERLCKIIEDYEEGS